MSPEPAAGWSTRPYGNTRAPQVWVPWQEGAHLRVAASQVPPELKLTFAAPLTCSALAAVVLMIPFAPLALATVEWHLPQRYPRPVWNVWRVLPPATPVAGGKAWHMVVHAPSVVVVNAGAVTVAPELVHPPWQ